MSDKWSDFVMSLQRLYRKRMIKPQKLDEMLQEKTLTGDEYLFITSGKEV